MVTSLSAHTPQPCLLHTNVRFERQFFYDHVTVMRGKITPSAGCLYYGALTEGLRRR